MVNQHIRLYPSTCLKIYILISITSLYETIHHVLRCGPWTSTSVYVIVRILIEWSSENKSSHRLDFDTSMTFEDANVIKEISLISRWDKTKCVRKTQSYIHISFLSIIYLQARVLVLRFCSMCKHKYYYIIWTFVA